jgi:hypothetical protein
MTSPKNRRDPAPAAPPSHAPDPVDENLDFDGDVDLEHGVTVEDDLTEPAAVPAGPARSTRPEAAPSPRSARTGARPQGKHAAGQAGKPSAGSSEGVHYVDDAASRRWVIAVAVAFALLFAYALVLGRGGLLTPLPAATPLPTAPIATAAPTAAAPSAASIAPSVPAASQAPAASPSASASQAPASAAASPAASGGASPVGSATP